jgi:hypothetical protein
MLALTASPAQAGIWGCMGRVKKLLGLAPAEESTTSPTAAEAPVRPGLERILEGAPEKLRRRIQAVLSLGARRGFDQGVVVGDAEDFGETGDGFSVRGLLGLGDFGGDCAGRA